MTNIKLPPWAPSLRPHQVSAIQQTLEAYERGDKAVFMEAPTGSGKTLIAEMVRQYLDCRGIYLCSSLSLQRQYMRDFPSASLLMGRSNYPTKDYAGSFGTGFNAITCADCTKKKSEGVFSCKWCNPVNQCPYELAKRDALISSQVCSNTYYYLYEVNHPGTLRNRQLVVIDECDTLEQILMSFVEVMFNKRIIERYRLPRPLKKTVESSWVEWVDEVNGIMTRYMASLPEPTMLSNSADIKEYKQVGRIVEGLKRLRDADMGIAAGGWVYTGYSDDDVLFKPVRVDRFAREYLWEHGLRFLLMSATIISTQEMADSLGLGMEMA